VILLSNYLSSVFLLLSQYNPEVNSTSQNTIAAIRHKNEYLDADRCEVAERRFDSPDEPMDVPLATDTEVYIFASRQHTYGSAETGAAS